MQIPLTVMNSDKQRIYKVRDTMFIMHIVYFSEDSFQYLGAKHRQIDILIKYVYNITQILLIREIPSLYGTLVYVI